MNPLLVDLRVVASDPNQADVRALRGLDSGRSVRSGLVDVAGRRSRTLRAFSPPGERAQAPLVRSNFSQGLNLVHELESGLEPKNSLMAATTGGH